MQLPQTLVAERTHKMSTEKTASVSGHKKVNRPLSHKEAIALLHEVFKEAHTDKELGMALFSHFYDSEWHPLDSLRAALSHIELGLMDAEAILLVEPKNIISNSELRKQVIQMITDFWAKTGHANLKIEETDIVPGNRSLSKKIEFVRLLLDVVDEYEYYVVNGPKKWSLLQPRAAELMQAVENRWPRGFLWNGPPCDKAKPATRTPDYFLNIGGERHLLSKTQVLFIVLQWEMIRAEAAGESQAQTPQATPASPTTNVTTDPAPKFDAEKSLSGAVSVTIDSENGRRGT